MPRARGSLPVSQRTLDLTQLVVSELVTNAREYAPGPVLLDLKITGDTVEVAVWDCDPVLPDARAADAVRVGPHGLEIVMAVAQGFQAQREPVGNRITARITLADDPGGAVSGRWPL
ncbi:ATP-binding protein [Streptomyces eurythermus]|uniref:ATP-binding protein n=1 Tax=Streptomyces eurythermus TaxID=42237 RepID=UPI003F4D3C45